MGAGSDCVKWGHEAKISLEELLLSGHVLPREKGNQGKKQKITYFNILSAFDIETTALQDIQQSFMYIWQWHFVNIETEDSITIYGRYWDEWQEASRLICDTLPSDAYMVVLDHNLSYEFQFLSSLYPFAQDEVFATNPREILKCTMGGHLEFRCTMRHSNTSLSVYTRQWHVKHQKLSGEEYDYNKIRFPWTELTEQELLYAFHDVIGLCEAYRAELEYWHDTLYTIPYTSTGYVRRICKKEWAKINYLERRAWVPDITVYKMLVEAFRGGDTHGDRRHATPADYGRAVIVENVASYDRVSSYPDVLVNCMYPLGDWHKIQTKKRPFIEPAELEKYIHQYEKSIVTRVHFTGLRLKNIRWEMPYIPSDKCLKLESAQLDNGRVIRAAALSMTITDPDWEIIKTEYTWETVAFSDTWYCRRRFLPEQFCEVVRQFYRDKTLLKGAEHGSLEEIEYGLKKSLLNALYGMCAQRVIRDNVVYIDDDNSPYISEWEYKAREQERETGRALTEREKREMQDKLEKEQLEAAKRKAFVPYQIGVWCTAWARLELHRAFWAVSEQGGTSIYADTDSCKCIGNIDFSRLNEYYKARSLARGAYADDRKGNRYYMGVYEHEYTAPRFAHMGAKKYIYEDEHGELHLTVAGVNKQKGAAELKKLGGFDAWHGGTVFQEAGGVQGVYNDTDYGYLEIDGHQLFIGRNVCLLPDSYTLGESTDYLRVLEYLLIHGEINGYSLSGGDD